MADDNIISSSSAAKSLDARMKVLLDRVEEMTGRANKLFRQSRRKNEQHELFHEELENTNDRFDPLDRASGIRADTVDVCRRTRTQIVTIEDSFNDGETLMKSELTEMAENFNSMQEKYNAWFVKYEQLEKEAKRDDHVTKVIEGDADDLDRYLDEACEEVRKLTMGAKFIKFEQPKPSSMYDTVKLIVSNETVKRVATGTALVAGVCGLGYTVWRRYFS